MTTAMESTQRLVQSWMVLGRDDEIETLALEINGPGQTSLLNVVKALGEYLTSEDGDLRGKGVELLSLLLSRCQAETLNRQAVRVLVTFYADKLDDTETILPALKGLVLLASLPTCGSMDGMSILRGVFKHVKMKALTAPHRFVVFSVIDNLMSRQRDVLKKMGDEFLSGYINLANGEKDPRNLLLCFAMCRVILIEFKIDNFVEALFNITFCYFPITYRQPTNDAFGITTDMLKDALLSCMNACPAFGPLATSVFIEKLTAGYPLTKIDTLRAISSCLPVYGASWAQASAGKLWSAIKLEIFHPADSAVETEALSATQALIGMTYGNQNGVTGGFAQDVCTECIQVLKEPEKSQAKAAIKIVCALLSTTASVRQYILSQTIPHLVNLFVNPDEVEGRSRILLLMSDVISATSSGFSATQGSVDHASALTPFKDDLLNVVIAGLQTPSTRCQGVTTLRCLLATPNFLTPEELSFGIHCVNQILLDDQDDDDASEAALDLLSTVSTSTPRLLLEQTLPPLFARMPDQAPPRDSNAERTKYWQILTILRQICVPAELFEVLVIRLMTKLDHLSVAWSLPENEDAEPSAAYAHSILATLVKTLSTKIALDHSDVPKYIHSLVPRLFRLFIHSAVLPESGQTIASDDRLVNLAAQIVTMVVRTLSQKDQEKFGASLCSAYLEGRIHGITEDWKSSSDVHFQPFLISASRTQKNLVAMFAATIVAFRQETQIPVADLNGFLDKLVTWSLVQECTSAQRDAAWHVIAVVINKRPSDVSSFLSSVMERIWQQEVLNKTRQIAIRRHGITLWRWITKALLLKNDSLSTQLVNCLFEVFDNEDIDWFAAKALGDICRSDIIFTKSNYAVIKLLYAQKFVNGILPRLLTATSSETQSRRNTSHLVALVSLLQPTPKAIYSHMMPTLMPFLLRGLDLPDEDLRANIIDILTVAAEGDVQEPNVMVEHASTLVSAMLKNAHAQYMPSTRVRIAALKYLGLLPNRVRYDVLHPFKSKTIKDLGKMLDDPKRSVRKEAVDTRTNWIIFTRSP